MTVACHGDGDNGGDLFELAVADHGRGHLQGEDDPDEDLNEGDDRDAAQTDAHHLGEKIGGAEPDFALDRRPVDALAGIDKQIAQAANELKEAGPGPGLTDDAAADGFDGADHCAVAAIVFCGCHTHEISRSSTGAQNREAAQVQKVSGLRGLILVLTDHEELVELGDFEDAADAIVQAEEDHLALISGDAPKYFDKGAHAG